MGLTGCMMSCLCKGSSTGRATGARRRHAPPPSIGYACRIRGRGGHAHPGRRRRSVHAAVSRPGAHPGGARRHDLWRRRGRPQPGPGGSPRPADSGSHAARPGWRGRAPGAAQQRLEPAVLMLSAVGQVDHRVESRQAGAADYLSKTFSFQELTARVEALHRRRQSGSETITELRIGDLSLDLISRHARRGGQLIELWPLEFRLLEYLLRNANQTVTRTMLLENVWNLHFDPQTNVVEVHMSRLRAKVDRPFPQRLIHTIRGEGYVIREP